MDGFQWIAEIGFRHLWQAVIICTIAGALLIRREKWSAEHRSWIWAIAVGLMGIMPVLTLLPTPGLETLPNVFSGPDALFDPESAAPLADAVRHAYRYDAMLVAPVTDTLDNSLISREFLFFSLLAVWSVFTIRSFGITFFAWRRTRELRANAIALARGHELLPRDWPADVTVAVSDEVGGPMAIGVLHPYVVLPRTLVDNLPAAQLRHVLAHELAHIERGDLICAFGQRLLLAVYWWSPFMRIACKALRSEREMACDDRAAARAGCSKNYATSLLDSAEALIVDRHATQKLIAVGAFERGQGNFFVRRIRRLTRADYRSELKLGGHQVLGLAGASAVIALLFVLSPRAAFSASHPDEDIFDWDFDVEAAVEDSLDYASAWRVSTSGTSHDAWASEASYERGTRVAGVSHDICCGELVEAIYDGDHSRKLELVRQGADVNCIEGEDTPLIAAIHEGDLGMVAWLLAQGADANISVPGNSPLMEAISHGETAITRKLLESGANPNIAINGEFPLEEAVKDGEVRLVEMLVQAGANPNIDTGHKTPLIRAVRDGDAKIARLLLEAGANPDFAPHGYDPALMTAIEHGDYEIVKYLVQAGADVNFSDRDHGDDFCAIQLAQERGHPKIAAFLTSIATGDRG